MVKPHIALELYIAEGAVLFRDLPGQGVGVGVVAFDQVFVLVELGMHQGDGALVLFRLLIRRLKIRSAPARAMMIEFICWETWLMAY